MTRPRPRSRRVAAQVEADSASLQQALADYEINILSAQAKIDQARADLQAAEIDLGYCRMFAPIDGRIGELQVKLGNLVGPATSMDDTTSLVTIQQLDPMGVDLRSASRYLPIITRLVKKGLEVKLRIGGQKAHPHTGKITFIDNTVEPTTSTVLVKAEVPNPDRDDPARRICESGIEYRRVRRRNRHSRRGRGRSPGRLTRPLGRRPEQG